MPTSEILTVIYEHFCFSVLHTHNCDAVENLSERKSNVVFCQLTENGIFNDFRWILVKSMEHTLPIKSIITEANRSLVALISFVALISAAYFHFSSKHNKNICWFGKSDVRILLEQCQNSVDALRFMCTYWWISCTIYFIYLVGFATYLEKIKYVFVAYNQLGMNDVNGEKQKIPREW